MKTLISFFVAAFICVATVSADDATIVANWTYPVGGWFPQASIPTVGIANYPRAQAIADSIANFDPTTAVFDNVWTSLDKQGVAGAGYTIANVTANALSDHGASDFTGAFKVMYDHNNFYVLLQYTDDNINGSEVVELMWAPYFDIPAIAAKTFATNVAANTKLVAPYARYAPFGGYKAHFTSALGFKDAMVVDFDAAGKGTFNANATPAVLQNNVFGDTKTITGTHVVKQIFSIGYQALTGNAYPAGLNARSDFNTSIWKALNSGKGISFDIHIIDTDADDVLNTATTPKIQPQEYWWNSTNNDGWCETYYSGFLAPSTLTALKSVYGNKPVIFGEVTSTMVKLTQNANVEVYNSIGKRVLSLKNTNNVDLTNMNKGVYIIHANNEALKFAR